MAISYGLAPNPIWYFTGIDGKNLAGGKIYTFDSLNKTIPKAVYQDSAAITAWPNPITLDANGTNGPFYWKFDSSSPTDLYYIEVRDANGVLQETIDNFPILSQSTGSSSSSTSATTNDLVVNGSFWRNTGTTNPVPLSLTLCPSLHSGLAANASPNIILKKNNTLASDTVSFPLMPLGSTALTPDATPSAYFNYTCTNSPAGETQKSIQIPLCAGVQNLSNQIITLSFYARSNNGNPSLPIYWYPFYGDGGSPSLSSPILITSKIISNTWARYTVTTTAPDPSGKTLGTCGNDALYWQIGLPLGAPSNIDIVKIRADLGTVAKSTDFINYDAIESIAMGWKTGDVRTTFGTNLSSGWVLMNDTSIGNTGSSATNRANIDTFPLFNLLWNNVSDANAPVSGGRGVSAIADFDANKRLTLPKALGRALASLGLPSSGGSGTTWAIGQVTGEELHTLTVNELAAHTHPAGQSNDYVGVPGPATAGLAGGATVGQTSFLPTGSAGGNQGHNTIQPTLYLNVYIKL